MAKRNSSEMQTGNAEGQVRRPKKGASFVGGARPSGLWAVPAAVFFFIFGILPLFIVVGLSFFKWNLGHAPVRWRAVLGPVHS